MPMFGIFDLVWIAFGASNILRLASYGPQIIAVARDQNGATAISFTCWSIWVCANTSTALYAWTNLGDAALTVISAFNASCCVTVLTLAASNADAVTLREGIGSNHSNVPQEEVREPSNFNNLDERLA